MTKKNESAWLSPKVLDWNWTYESWTDYSKDDWKRPYEIWAHAEELIDKHNDDSYLVDAITTLKRAVNFRINYLLKLYSFEKIDVDNKPSRPLEQLAYWGIIRPTMLRKLIDIRNAIEHEDASPPNLDRCVEFLDFVWYFLRSTDNLSQVLLDDFNLDDPKSENSIMLSTGPSLEWKVQLMGWMTASFFSWVKIEGWLHLKVVKSVMRSELIKQDPRLRKSHKGKNPNDILVYEAFVDVSQQYLKKICKRYFEALLRGGTF